MLDSNDEWTPTEWYYYLTDTVGSVVAVVDSSGAVVNRYDGACPPAAGRLRQPDPGP